MKVSMYFNYTLRSLRREGRHAVLAFFCVAVGVMAIVALRLVGLMINNALTSNVRDANGGDVSVTTLALPFTPADLDYFAGLKRSGAITGYTAVGRLSGSLSNAISVGESFTVLLVDPQVYPLVTAPTVMQPSGAGIAPLLGGGGALIDQTVASTSQRGLGQQLNLHLSSGQQSSGRLSLRVAGLVADTGVLAQYNGQGVILVSQAAYQQALPRALLPIDTIEITTASASRADGVARQISEHFLGVSTRTVADALQARQSLVESIKKFLQIAGLLALLIGGVGVVNTMQVLLTRRRIEIAMLKTTGYRRRDLYLLFGLSACLLGLIGGLLGAGAAIGVSFVVRGIVQQGFGLMVPFVLDWPTIAAGLLIGLATALIFGLMPIVQAANVRPLAVIRELPEGRGGSRALTIALLFILSLLFCLMAVVILNDVLLGVGAVYGAFIFLLILSAGFTLVVFVVSKLPVPERLNRAFLGLIIGCALVCALLTLVLPTFGLLLLALTGLGFLCALLPRTWKASTRMALRNLDRQRARTTTTLLALFVGVFTIGLILVLGQNLRDSIDRAVAGDLTYNVITSASAADASALQAGIGQVPGLRAYTRHTLGQAQPLQINGRRLQDILQNTPQNPDFGTLGRAGVLGLLSSVEGYDVAAGRQPAVGNGLSITSGRNLQAGDATTSNVLIPWALANLPPLKGQIGVGSTLVLQGVGGAGPLTLHVVGVYRSSGFNVTLGEIFAPASVVQALGPGSALAVFYLRIDPSQVRPALARIGQIAPGAGSFNLANLGDFIDQYLNYMILILVTIASLSLLAAVIIIANAVALAMLERRWELGILKAVGYTSATVLSEVLIENTVVGGLGALLAMLLVTLVTGLLGRFVFHASFAVPGLFVVGLIIGSALLAGLAALLVAWGPVRVRPLSVLRYE
jgi:ABC-type antimicrobial peptide transport system permease subunit